MTTPDLSNRREVDLSVPIHKLPVWVWILSIVLFVVPLLVYGLLHPTTLGNLFRLESILYLIVLVIVHEGVHAIAWKYASGLPWSAFSFGFDKKSLSPYCHADTPMDVRAYRIGGGAPLVLVGVLPYLIALLIGDAVLAFLGAVMISAAVGDIFVLWTLRNVPDGALCLDHPSQAGCIVYLPENSPSPSNGEGAGG